MKETYSKYLLALLLFGSNGIVASYIALSSYEIVFLRSLIGSLFLVIVFAVSRQKLQIGKSKKDLGYLIISGAAMGFNWIFLYEAYVHIGVSLATLACYCGPVIVMALAPIVFKEKMTVIKVLGFLSVIIGMLLVNGPELEQGKFSWGLFCGIMSAVMYAVMVISNKKVEGITGLENSMGQITISFLTVAVFLLIKQGLVVTIPSGSLIPVLLLGVLNTGVGCYLYFSSIPRLPAQSVAILGYLEPVSALFLSAIFLSERLTAVQLLGTVFILGGAIFAERWGRKQELQATLE